MKKYSGAQPEIKKVYAILPKHIRFGDLTRNSDILFREKLCFPVVFLDSQGNTRKR